jgi:hypothetical protein
MERATAAARERSISPHVTVGTFVWVKAALNALQKLAGMSTDASWLPPPYEGAGVERIVPNARHAGWMDA